MTFAQALRQWRQRAFLTQKALADTIPVALSTVQKWEMGQTVPYPATRRRLIEVLGITPEEFFAVLEADPQASSRGKAVA